MSSQTAERTGMLIVRLWIETDHRHGLRARITQSRDTIGREESVAVAASADDICAIVKEWVDDFADLDPRDDDGARTDRAVTGP